VYIVDKLLRGIFMKKLIAALLALTMSIGTALGFGGCDLDDLFGNKNGGGTTNGNGASDNKDNPPPPDCGTYYRVTATGIDDLFYEPLENLYEADTEVEVKLNVITDVSLYVFVNDKRVEQSHYDSDYWGYKFTMPHADIVIHITTDEYYGVEICDFDVPFYWVKYCQSENVVKIQRERGYYGVSPDILPEVVYITDKAEIENICTIFNCKLKPIPNPHIDGGGYVTYTFYTADAEYELQISNGYPISISFSDCRFFEIVEPTD
ncbi:MAG: hypothetical protein K2N23_08050, partial [Clostridia bacterium]|nr:hypothetical protein [Clostridia bacterium]